MAAKRLTDVIREECLRDGVDSYQAFQDLATVRGRYPKVAEAIEREAELRPTIGGQEGVLDRLARPFLDAELGARGDLVESVGDDDDETAPE
jgi:hypothetical protein